MTYSEALDAASAMEDYPVKPKAAERLAAIEAALAKKDGVVVVATAWKATYYDHRHAGKTFFANGHSLYVRRGKHVDCLDFTPIKTGEWK